MGSDLAFGTQLATEMEANLGFGDSLVHLVPSGSKQVREVLLSDYTLRHRVEASLDKAYEDARSILEESAPAHQALVDALMQRHKLEGQEVLEIISGANTSVRCAICGEWRSTGSPALRND